MHLDIICLLFPRLNRHFSLFEEDFVKRKCVFLPDEKSQFHAHLVHKLVTQYIQGESAWVEKYPTRRHVPKVGVNKDEFQVWLKLTRSGFWTFSQTMQMAASTKIHLVSCLPAFIMTKTLADAPPVGDSRIDESELWCSIRHQ